MSLEAEIKKLTDAIIQLHQAIDLASAVTQLVSKEESLGVTSTPIPSSTSAVVQEGATADECRELCRKIVSGDKEKKSVIKEIIASFDGAKLVDDVTDLEALKKALMEIV
jgi:hypothetical protein